MSTATDRKAPKRRVTVLAGIEVALWLLAVGCLGWVAGTYVDARLFQANAAIVESAGGGTADVEDPRPPSAPGVPIARLRIPRLDLSVVVVEGTSRRVLQRAVGHLPASARPAGDGNVVLAGHRDTFFRPLEEIRVGDRILLDTPQGSVAYEVEWTRTVEPSAVEVLEDPNYPALTLVTCYPFRFVGSAPRRFVVRARRDHPPTAEDGTLAARRAEALEP